MTGKQLFRAYYPRSGTDYSPVETLDPVCPYNNVTKAAFRVVEVLSLFATMHGRLVDRSQPHPLQLLFPLQ